MQRVVVTVSTRGPIPAGGTHPGWTVSYAARIGGADQPIGAERDMPATAYRLALPSGQPRSVVVPTPGVNDPADLEQVIARVVDGAPAVGDLATYGGWLLDALFGPLWPDIEAAADPGAGLELALSWSHDDHHLSSLVWEAMHAPPLPGSDPNSARQPLAALARSRPLVAITRLVTQAAQPPAGQPDLPVTGVPRVLFALGADPLDPDVRPGAMFLGLLRSIEAEGTCVSRVVTAVSAEDLTESCRRFQPDLVHLVAHGALDSEDEVALELNGEWVGHRRIRNAVGEAKAVFLSACDSARAGAEQASLAARLVHDGIPVVVGMAGRIDVGACRLFTRNLVEAVMRGESLMAAAATGRRAALLHGGDSPDELDWALPSVFMAAGLDPDQHLVDNTATKRASKIARSLGVDGSPVFVGRREVIEAADALLPRVGETRDDGARRGLLVAHAKGSLRKLGSQRVLSEIAWRYVRAGHVPLLLGKSSLLKPKTFVEIVAEILETIVAVRSALGLDQQWPRTLSTAGPATPSHEELGAAIRTFAETPANANDVKARLWLDFEILVDEFARLGPPFGAHTHVAVLGSAAHEWGPGLAELLDSLTDEGLGRPSVDEAKRLLVPLIVTGVIDDDLDVLASRQSDLLKIGSLWQLEVFEEEEAVAAYNLTMLQAGHRFTPPTFVNAFVAREGQQARWDNILRTNYFTKDRSPANLGNELWMLVLAHADDVEHGPIRMVGENDDAAIDRLMEGSP